MTYEEVRKRMFASLDECPIIDDEELIVYLASESNMPEEHVRRAYREWSKTKFAMDCSQ